ncbi:hypothetical protein PENSTE_c046G06093 [Penicillium steckii]|uniref:Uncharacterized protein n=1 Tax=Penicillium steckii TaxID=303698 RepID=A0A1V6SI92_9EURO|nr:hypothetical protein PENSTE_c046G06093 [Penicillium steckii]
MPFIAGMSPATFISPEMPEATPRLFSTAPDCYCGARMSRRRTNRNDNGNKNRWRYECRDRSCKKIVFDDWEGVRDENPLCDCEEFTRGQMKRDGVFVFRCARNECYFREELQDD